jgi:branched-chain amino acid aminotransferase
VGKRANARYARREAIGRGYDDAVMVNERGKVAEFTDSAAFFVRNGVVVTPSVTSDNLESITRDTCIQLLRNVQGAAVEEREVDSSELYILDEAWQGDTVAGLTPVVEIDGITVGAGRPGPIFCELQDTFVRVRQGELEQWTVPSDWHTVVQEPEGLPGA